MLPKSYANITNFGDLNSFWYKSYQHELDNMYGMNILSAVRAQEVPPEETIIDSRLDFRIKCGPSGEIAECKTRL